MFSIQQAVVLFALIGLVVGDDECSLPTESPCTSYYVDYVNQKGMYYDESCINGGYHCWSSTYPTDTDHAACRICSYADDGDCPSCVAEQHSSWCTADTADCCEDRCIMLDSVALAARGIGLASSNCTAGVDTFCDSTHDNCQMCIFDTELLEDWCPSGTADTADSDCELYTSLGDCSLCMDTVYDQIWNKVGGIEDTTTTTTDGSGSNDDEDSEDDEHYCSMPTSSRCVDIVSEMDLREGLMLVHDSECTFADPGCHVYTRNCRYCVADYNASLSAGHNSYIDCPECAIDHYVTAVTGSSEAVAVESSSPRDNTNSNPMTGLIVGLTLGGVLLVSAAALAYFYHYRRSKNGHNAYKAVKTKAPREDDEVIEPLEVETSSI